MLDDISFGIRLAYRLVSRLLSYCHRIVNAVCVIEQFSCKIL